MLSMGEGHEGLGRVRSTLHRPQAVVLCLNPAAKHQNPDKPRGPHHAARCFCSDSRDLGFILLFWGLCADLRTLPALFGTHLDPIWGVVVSTLGLLCGQIADSLRPNRSFQAPTAPSPIRRRSSTSPARQL